MLAVWSGEHLALSLVTEVENGIGTRFGLCVHLCGALLISVYGDAADSYTSP